MRELNRSLVLDILKADSPISRAAIAQRTKLAKPTVSGIVDDLIAEGLVRQIGLGVSASDGGRPPILLEFNRQVQFVAGVHVGVRTTTIVIGDAAGTEVTRRAIPTPKTAPPIALAKVAEQIKGAGREAGIPLRRLLAIGVALPGLTDFNTGVCLLAPNLGWHNVPVRTLLRDSIKVPVHVHHTGQAAVVAEYFEGVGKGHDDLAMLYAGSGLGTGILSGGKVFHGYGGIAGELGHCQVPGVSEPCHCGKVGCLETIASAPALIRMARKAIQGRRRTALAAIPARSLHPARIKEAALDGDAVALEVVERLGHNLGLAASWLINMVNPEMLVFGGGLADFGELLMTPLRQRATELGLPQATAGTQIALSQLGQDAEVRGAVLLALQQSETYYRVVFQA
jgi:glucokinase-like ROK family protein